MFLETLVDFILVHKEDLQDWLFVLLTQLLKKMGADLLGSVQAKVQKALDITRWVSLTYIPSAFIYFIYISNPTPEAEDYFLLIFCWIKRSPFLLSFNMCVQVS